MLHLLCVCVALFFLAEAEADPCTQISPQFLSNLQQHLPPGTLIFGPQAYPSIRAESLVFVPARPQTDMVEVTINGSERLDLRTAYILTGKMQFRSLAVIAGCDLYDQPELVDFTKTPDAFAITKPSLFMVSHCSGRPERARLVSVQDAFLFHVTGEPFCVIFEPDLFDPFGLAECSK
ncbi:MAG TPA: hypothetical protein VJ521_11990, partial [Acidobacteriota bacterium]|nr:hypothetical protein [Acidobacteriota bacterium]